ncbi:MAG: TRZ/ATZ family protein [Elusimicrobia bacterium]|nr:TRZ/ATZ family protein [Elusimicrobiota bacterium]
MKSFSLPLDNIEGLSGLKAGEEIFISGELFTARDRVHKLISSGKADWPFKLKGSGIYYTGPTPAKENYPLGSCGPTTSYRMDPFTPELYKKGLAVTIGKGPRSQEVSDAIRESGGVYLVAYGGCGALYGGTVKKAEVLAFEEFGPQAVYRIEVEDFPAIVGIDSRGKSIFSGEIK